MYNKVPIAPPAVIKVIERSRWLLAREPDTAKRQRLENLIYYAVRGSSKAVGELSALLRART